MGIQMTIPFTVLDNGVVSTESVSDIQISQRVGAIVGTELGQRAMRAGMGLPLSRLLFGISDDLVTAELRDKVTDQLNAYEPGLNVRTVNTESRESKDVVAKIQVEYTPILKASSARAVADTATIEIGGTVREVTSIGNTK
jgi:phage baseplate assembly protein W